MATTKAWYSKESKFPEGDLTVNDFVLKEEKLPAVKDGEILIEALYLSLDPYVRLIPSKDCLQGEQIARIIESKAPGFPVGALVSAHAGWRTRSVIDVKKPLAFNTKVELIQDVPGLATSLWLGSVGISGLTAYMSFLERCNPKKGEVIVVTAAAGALGSLVGQLAKLQGLTVIGLAGSKDKCDYIKELGFDHVIDYKQENVSAALDRIAPNGIDIYYDCVGGEISDVAYGKLRDNGRVLIVGQISTYNREQPKVTNWNMNILLHELEIRGFSILSQKNVAEYPRVRKALLALVLEGKLKFKEHITEGFENAANAFLELFSGANFGKALVKA